MLRVCFSVSGPSGTSNSREGFQREVSSCMCFYATAKIESGELSAYRHLKKPAKDNITTNASTNDEPVAYCTLFDDP